MVKRQVSQSSGASYIAATGLVLRSLPTPKFFGGKSFLCWIVFEDDFVKSHSSEWLLTTLHTGINKLNK